MTTTSKILSTAVSVFALGCSVAGADVTDAPVGSSAAGDPSTPAQTELMQGVNERQHEAAIEKADNEHQAEMKKCEGLVWEEAKLCKDLVGTETAQTQAKVEKDREKETPAPSP